MVDPEGLDRAGAPAAAAADASDRRLRPADYEEYAQADFSAES